MPALRFHHFAVSVADMERTASWYVSTLDFQEQYRYEVPEMGLRAVFLSHGDFRLEIFEMAQSRPPTDPQSLDSYLGVRGLKHIALSVTDLDAVRTELSDRGVSFVNDITDVPGSGGERFCFITDPDGVLIEMYQPVDNPGSAHAH